jgi:hypothetical protein
MRHFRICVYNARKRQEGGDAAATYFERTECVAGVQDARFQQLMPDVHLHQRPTRRADLRGRAARAAIAVLALLRHR